MTYDQPEGLVLKDGQKWNKQHGYVATDAKLCKEDALIAAYNADGRPALRTWVKEQAGKGVAVPSYPTCTAWLNPKGESTGSTAFKAEKAAPAQTSSFSVEIDLGQKFNEAYEAARPAAYLKFLQEESAAIRAKVLADTDARIQAEIEKLTGKPSVAE